MTTDNVVQEQVSKETTPPVAEVKPPEAQAQPITEERLQQLMAQEREVLIRRFQSDKDKAVAEVRREADKALRRERLEKDAIRSSVKGIQEGDDPAKALELAELRARDQIYQQSDVEERQRKELEAYSVQLKQSLKDHLKEVGIDEADKRIDWAEDAQDFLSGRGRFDKSVAQILKGNQTKAQEAMKATLESEVSKIRKELGLDKVNTVTSSGAVNNSDAEFLKGFGDGSLPASKENVARYEKLRDKD